MCRKKSLNTFSKVKKILFTLQDDSWCFTMLSTVFQSYHGDSSHYSCLSSTRLGLLSVLPKDTPTDFTR